MYTERGCVLIKSSIYTRKVSDSNLGHFIGYVSSEVFKRIDAHTGTGIKKPLPNL